ncbi:MAG: hypothetical protein WBQ91_10035 [Candidatus Acidiferrum sp.]
MERAREVYRRYFFDRYKGKHRPVTEEEFALATLCKRAGRLHDRTGTWPTLAEVRQEIREERAAYEQLREESFRTR